MTGKGPRGPEVAAKDDDKARSKPNTSAPPVDAEDVAHEKPLEWGLFLRAMSFLKPYKRQMAVNVGIVAVASGAMLLGAEAISRVVGAIEERDRLMLMTWIVVMAAVALGRWAVDFLREFRLVKLGTRVMLDLRLTLFGHLQRLSLSYFNRNKQGWIISRATSDLDVLEDLITNTVPQLAWVLLLIAMGTIRVFWKSPLLGLVLLAAVPLMFLLTFGFKRHIAQAWRDVRTQVSRICANLAENIAGVRVVQAFTRERRNLHEFDRLNSEYYRARVRASVVNALYHPSIGLLMAFATAGVILVGGHMAQSGAAQAAQAPREVAVEAPADAAAAPADAPKRAESPFRPRDLVLVLMLLRMFFEPIRQLSQMYGTALGAMAAGERIFGLLDTQPDVRDLPGAIDLPRIEGDVRFEEVSFAYNEGVWVLRDVDIHAKPGETLALVGPTGAGKSSVVNLLCRFYEPQQGRILIDGVDMKQTTLQSLHSQMGIVMQDAFLFSGTVMDNIRFGRPDATDEECIAAARAIGAHEIIAELRDGYQTQVQERGEALSGGQRQLVCFTRAMVADPRILVLDEATSSVDTRTEEHIQRALNRLVQKRTSFVVAHRLSTVRNADQVLVVNDGRIVERGTHNELLAAGGEYARMYTEFLREG